MSGVYFVKFLLCGCFREIVIAIHWVNLMLWSLISILGGLENGSWSFYENNVLPKAGWVDAWGRREYVGE